LPTCAHVRLLPRARGRFRLSLIYAAEMMKRLNGDVRLVSRYQKMANEVASIPTRNVHLITIRDSVTIVAREVAKIGHARFALCDFLLGWRKAGWAKAFYWEQFTIPPFRLVEPYGVDTKAVDEARKKALDASVSLNGLLTPRQRSDVFALTTEIM
jgi:hypothetical protein